MRSAIRIAYKCAALARRLYWFVIRPRTRGVKCLIEHDGKWLLIKNSYGHNAWTLPGGACRRRENPVDAAAREVAEEVGITPIEMRPLGSFFTDREYKRDTVYCFHAVAATADHRVDGTEVVEAAWFKPGALPEKRSRTIASVVRLLAADGDS
jgi:ADP-ribose pyrophosphatase YjhB (NUDIX family)